MFYHITDQATCLLTEGGGLVVDFIGRVEHVDEDMKVGFLLPACPVLCVLGRAGAEGAGCTGWRTGDAEGACLPTFSPPTGSSVQLAPPPPPSTHNSTPPTPPQHPATGCVVHVALFLLASRACRRLCGSSTAGCRRVSRAFGAEGKRLVGARVWGSVMGSRIPLGAGILAWMRRRLALHALTLRHSL